MIRRNLLTKLFTSLGLLVVPTGVASSAYPTNPTQGLQKPSKKSYRYIASVATRNPSTGELKARTVGLKFDVPSNASLHLVSLYDIEARKAIARKVDELSKVDGVEVDYRIVVVKV